MPIENLTRRNFLYTAALGSAGAVMLPHNAQAHESDVYYTRTEWDTAAFNELLRAKRAIKQIIDMTQPDGKLLAFHTHSMMTGLERGFGIPANRILAVAALHSSANALNFDDYAWGKYRLGAWLKIDDPETKRPAERNIFYVSTIAPDGKYASDDPDDRRSIEWDMSLQAMQRRGVQLLSCHLATEYMARNAVTRLNLHVSTQQVVDDLTAHMLPGVLAVPSMVSAIPVMETQGRFTYLRL